MSPDLSTPSLFLSRSTVSVLKTPDRDKRLRCVPWTRNNHVGILRILFRSSDGAWLCLGMHSLVFTSIWSFVE